MAEEKPSRSSELETALQYLVDLCVGRFFGTVKLHIHDGEIKQVTEKRTRKVKELGKG